jgi:hypothetical protein
MLAHSTWQCVQMQLCLEASDVLQTLNGLTDVGLCNSDGPHPDRAQDLMGDLLREKQNLHSNKLLIPHQGNNFKNVLIFFN